MRDGPVRAAPDGPIQPNPFGDRPEVHPSAFLDPTARIIGRVKIGQRVFVGPNAVVRADEPDDRGRVRPITIADDCNVQDGVIVHALAGTEVTIGPGSSLAHGAIVHGPCIIGEGCFIGFGAVVFGSRLDRGVFVSSRAVVENVNVPPDTFIPPAAVVSKDLIGRLRKTQPDQRRFMADVVSANRRLAEGYLGLANALGDGDR
jgi:carbonic anhydrase/acetyltransferase-like protein (isoleucine patch superfamily)